MVGARLASSMVRYHTLAEVAKVIHVSRKFVQDIERDALWKVYIRITEK